MVPVDAEKHKLMSLPASSPLPEQPFSPDTGTPDRGIYLFDLGIILAVLAAVWKHPKHASGGFSHLMKKKKRNKTF